jgi:hypothetical protein
MNHDKNVLCATFSLVSKLLFAENCYIQMLPLYLMTTPDTTTKLRKWMARSLFFIFSQSMFSFQATCGSQQYVPTWYRTMAEPVLQEEKPAPFLAIQGLVTLFYFLPGYLAVAWGIMNNPGQRWLQDLAVILAGASSQVNDYRDP